jgi:Fur family ferric uptake transcriptional regulator
MERNTRQRSAIRGVIAKADRPLLPQEVLEAAHQLVPAMSLGTVYRNLKTLVEEGELQQVNLPGENPRFELVGHQHHHHFQCLYCQRVFDVYACPGDMSRMAPQGFTMEDHDLTLYGRCKECTGPAAKTVGRKAVEAGARTRTHTHTHTHRYVD